MIKATSEILKGFDELWEKRKAEILNTKDNLKITGTAYYVSNDGDDNNDGLSDATAWKSLDKVSNADLKHGDGVFFKRGDLFRGHIEAKEGVLYAAYGKGDKPKLYSSDRNLADKALWELYDKEHNIWKLNYDVRDVGTLVFGNDELTSRKLIPSFKKGKFVCRDNTEIEFSMPRDMDKDLDMYWSFKGEIRYEDDPIIIYTPETLGELYLRCDKGNPGEVFNSIEPLLRIHGIRNNGYKDVRIDNLCIKYMGGHGIVAGTNIENFSITNCEFGFIGGTIQNFNANAQNPDRRGVITRFGNAIEIYGSCKNFTVDNNYVYEVYDAGMTQQVTSDKKMMHQNIIYSNNMIEKCVYGMEYFLTQTGEEKGKIINFTIENNFIRLSGYGWGQQRYNPDTPALIQSWETTNLSENFVIKNNIFDRGKYNYLVLAALTDEDCPKLDGNTYIQHLGGPLGRYGGYGVTRLERMVFDLEAEEKINTVFGDKTAKVYYVD